MKVYLKKIALLLGTVVLSVLATALFIEYNFQNNKYGEDVIQAEIFSKSMNEKRPFIVHLPKNYDSDTSRRYPVMYILDGTSQDIHTAHKIDILSEAKVFPEAIVVGIPNTSGNRSRDFTPHYMKIDLEDEDSKRGNGNNFLRFFEKELIPYIDANYRTSSFRSLSGNSRGGLFALYAMLEKPGLFNAYMCYSPAFWREDKLIVNRAEALLRKGSKKKVFLYMSLGSEENEKMKRGFVAMEKMINRNRPEGMSFYIEVTPKSDHGSNSYNSTVSALAKLGSFMNIIENSN
ncbi:hypothetical protein GWK08_09285 [Leptobacterium flavescens]|uniref:Alpha/beta hydrolase n=1 Tax=Leptobacterium flavescens TaxID=472055 RepID=A0A6P0UP62_9FLAO|nr:alpha/beta hydrolase-fold protein [Leptobacterium flavescens]NER13629.1 hypothetical protein [Leptobacterium flavescens]